MARRSRIQGDFKLRGVLRRIGNQMESDLRPAMQKAADLVLETQRQLIPVDTGAGRDALTAFVSKSGLDAQIGVRGKKMMRRFFYLRFVEYGTKGASGSIYQRANSSKVGGVITNNRDKSQLGGRRNALRKRDTKNKSDGQNFYGYYPDIPRRAAHPFIRPSYDLNKDAIRKLLSEAIASTLDKAARSADG